MWLQESALTDLVTRIVDSKRSEGKVRIDSMKLIKRSRRNWIEAIAK